MEAASLALCQAYIEACGRVLHHNIDKGLLVAGQSTPQPGGGQILKPMRLVFGDRATAEVNGRPIAVGEIVEAAIDSSDTAAADKAMRSGWVFGGSRFVREDETGRRFFLADRGDFLCVSNFSSALLDVPVRSSEENAKLSFKAFTENIPTEKTKVRLVLIPEAKANAPAEGSE